MQVNTKYVISTRGTSSFKKEEEKSIHIAHRSVEKKRFRCPRRFHTNTHVHQPCSYNCGACWAVMTLTCELIVFAPVYDGYVWLGVEIANNSQLSCKTFRGPVFSFTPDSQASKGIMSFGFGFGFIEMAHSWKRQFSCMISHLLVKWVTCHTDIKQSTLL